MSFTSDFLREMKKREHTEPRSKDDYTNRFLSKLNETPIKETTQSENQEAIRRFQQQRAEEERERKEEQRRRQAEQEALAARETRLQAIRPEAQKAYAGLSKIQVTPEQGMAAASKHAANSYQGSKENNTVRKERLLDAINMVISGGGSVADAPVTLFEAPDQKEQTLNARANYFKLQEQQQKDMDLMAEDLAELNSWPEEDRAALERYIIDRNSRTFSGSTDTFEHADYNARELMNKYGARRVKELAESYQRKQNADNAEKTAQRAQDGAGKGFWAGAGHSAATIPANILGSITSPLGYVGETGQRTGRYQTLDPNNPGNLPNIYSGAVREEVAKNIEGNGGALGKAGSYLYQGGMSVADSMTRLGLGGGAAGAAGLAAAGSFGQGIRQYSQQGAAPMEAVTGAAAQAGMEYLTEKIPMDELLKAGKGGVKTFSQAAKAAGKQALSEIATEEASLLGTKTAENLILGEKAGYNQRVAQLVAEGASIAAARKLANREVLQEATDTAIISGISGGLSSVGQSAGLKAADAVKQKTGAQRITDAVNQTIVQGRAQQAEKNTASEETAVNVRSANTAITEENKAKRTLAYTLATNLDVIQDMEPVSRLTGKEFKKVEGQTGVDQIRTFFKSLGNKVFRSGFGDVALNEYGVGGIMNHRPLNRAKMVSVAAVPEVIRNGRQIYYDPNWKGRGYETYIFAAPVTVGTTDVYVAAVVNKRPDNKFYLSEMVDSEGNYVRIEESPSGNSKYGATDGAGVPGGADAPLGPEGLPEERIPSATGAEPTPLPSISIPGKEANVNGDSSSADRKVNAEDSLGAAPLGFGGEFTRMQFDYGNLPSGENPVRPDDMPRSTDGKDRVSQTAVTVKGAKVTPDEFVPLLENKVVSGGMSYIPITNDATIQKAMETISNEGWEEARANWSANVRGGRTGADMSAVGALLLNNAANAGDKEVWLNILDDYRRLGTNTAQGLQAFRILKTLDPDDQLYMMERSLDQMVKDMHLQTEITIDEELKMAYRDAQDNKAKDAALKDIQKYVANQIPSTFSDKWTALRYVNMLGNFRTQGRNIIGNLGNTAVYWTKDKIGAALEKVLVKPENRTKALVLNKDMVKAAKADFAEVQNVVQNGGKFNDPGQQSTEFAQGVQDQRRIFKSPILEGYRKVTNWAMEQGDVVFSRNAYARALAGFLKARGITETDLSKVEAKTMDDARLYAIRQAQETTFRDNNMVSDWISKIGRRKDTPAAARAIAEGVLPFRKTPANVLVRAEEYSPLGLINTAVKTVQAAKGNATGAEVVDSLAKSLTGTGLFILGAALGDMGYLVGGPDEDEDKQYFDDLNGYQNYALQFPDGTNLTIDFLSPSAIPMFLGAQIAKVAGDEQGLTLKDLEKVFTSISDPLIEMSMLQGVNDTLDAIKYSDNNIGQFLLNAATSYLTQGLTNTLLGQMERSSEKSRMTTYVDKGSDTPAWLQRQMGKASAKIPGLDYHQMEYRNAWGETEDNPEGAANWLYQMLSPSYVDKAEVDDVAKELYRLNEVQDKVNVFPDSPESTLSYTDKNGTVHKDFALSMEQYETLQTTMGQTQARIVSELVKCQGYKALTDEQKAKAIGYAYDYAREKGRKETIEGYDGMDSWMEGIAGKEAGAIINKVAAAGITDAFSSLTESWREGYDEQVQQAAKQELETAYETYKGLDDGVRKQLKESASGRVEAYLNAREKNISTDTFLNLYRQYYDLDQSSKSNSEKAQEWSYTLEKAREKGTITESQKQTLKDSMTFMQMFPAETEKFDQLVEKGISADDAQNLGWVLKGLESQEGYKEVRYVQQAEAIAGADLTEEEKAAALMIYGSDSQDENLEQMRSLGFTVEDYVTAYRMYSDANGQGKKQRTIAAYQEQFDVDYETAKAIYEIYG